MAAITPSSGSQQRTEPPETLESSLRSARRIFEVTRGSIDVTSRMIRQTESDITEVLSPVREHVRLIQNLEMGRPTLPSQHAEGSQSRAPHTMHPSHPEAHTVREIFAAMGRAEQRMAERQSRRADPSSPALTEGQESEVRRIFGDPRPDVRDDWLSGAGTTTLSLSVMGPAPLPSPGPGSERNNFHRRLREDAYFDGPLPRRPAPQPAFNPLDFGATVERANASRHSAALRDNQDGAIYLKETVREYVEALSGEHKKSFEEKLAAFDEEIFSLIPFIAVKRAVSFSSELTKENIPLFMHKYLKSLRVIQKHVQRFGRQPDEQELRRTLGPISTALSRETACIASIQKALELLSRP